jgi:chaperonin cofactor prefoldin
MDYDERIHTLEEQVAAISERVRRVAEGLRDATRIIVTLKAVLIEEGVLTAEQFDAKLRELGIAIDEIRRLEDMFGQEGA